jgi:hypothetical protein
MRLVFQSENDMTRRFIYCNDILFQYIIWGKLFAKTVESFGYISEDTALARGLPLKKLLRSCVELTKKKTQIDRDQNEIGNIPFFKRKMIVRLFFCDYQHIKDSYSRFRLALFLLKINCQILAPHKIQTITTISLHSGWAQNVP